jgi:hypothetical protein
VKNSESTLQRYLLEKESTSKKQNMLEAKLTIPKSFAKDLKTKTYDSSAIKNAQVFEKLPINELYSKKISNGVFSSPRVNRN